MTYHLLQPQIPPQKNKKQVQSLSHLRYQLANKRSRSEYGEVKAYIVVGLRCCIISKKFMMYLTYFLSLMVRFAPSAP